MTDISDRAWNIFLAGFLWTLLLATATALVRCVRERLQRGDRWNGMEQVGNVMVTTRPYLLAVAPVFYASSLLVAIAVGPVHAPTSPFCGE